MLLGDVHEAADLDDVGHEQQSDNDNQCDVDFVYALHLGWTRRTFGLPCFDEDRLRRLRRLCAAEVVNGQSGSVEAFTAEINRQITPLLLFAELMKQPSGFLNVALALKVGVNASERGPLYSAQVQLLSVVAAQLDDVAAASRRC